MLRSQVSRLSSSRGVSETFVEENSVVYKFLVESMQQYSSDLRESAGRVDESFKNWLRTGCTAEELVRTVAFDQAALDQQWKDKQNAASLDASAPFTADQLREVAYLYNNASSLLERLNHVESTLRRALPDGLLDSSDQAAKAGLIRRALWSKSCSINQLGEDIKRVFADACQA